MIIDILPLGDRALLVNFPQKIDPDIHQKIMELSGKLADASIEGITFILPAYCSLTIGYNPEQIDYQGLSRKVNSQFEKQTKPLNLSDRFLTIPVCYEEPFSLDLLEISKFTGLNPEEIIEMHTAATYLVYMLGFLPGFPYLGILPESLQCPRKATPRLRVPERSIGLAGMQTGIYPSESPGGWNIIGNTPLSIFNPRSDSPFLLKPGDKVKFRSITKADYGQIETEINQNSFSWDSIYG